MPKTRLLESITCPQKAPVAASRWLLERVEVPSGAVVGQETKARMASLLTCSPHQEVTHHISATFTRLPRANPDKVRWSAATAEYKKTCATSEMRPDPAATQIQPQTHDPSPRRVGSSFLQRLVSLACCDLRFYCIVLLPCH